MIELRGVTWNHTRGYLPMLATAQRFSELHPEVRINWEKRTLQEFADSSLERLSEKFDLLVIDHPFIGRATARGSLLPLDQHLEQAFLNNQAEYSVGKSHASYCYRGRQWALAIDAAAPVCGWRRDLLESAGAVPPNTWTELLDLARLGLIAFPGIPIDSLMHVYMLLIGLGEEPFAKPGVFASVELTAKALEMLRELAQLVSPDCAKRNPIATWELLAGGESIALCPFAYGYANYSRDGFAAHVIETGGLIRIDGHAQCRSTLGGAGLAISARCGEIAAAVEYCRFTASSTCQARLYFDSGGQPGHRSAWLDKEVNRRSHDFFRTSLDVLDDAWLRPRWDGYLGFQETAANVVHRYVWCGGDPRAVAEELNRSGGLSHETT